MKWSESLKAMAVRPAGNERLRRMVCSYSCTLSDNHYRGSRCGQSDRGVGLHHGHIKPPRAVGRQRRQRDTTWLVGGDYGSQDPV